MAYDTFELHDTFTSILFVSERKQHFLVNKISTESGGCSEMFSLFGIRFGNLCSTKTLVEGIV